MRRQGRNTDYFEAMQTDEFDFLRAETMMIIPKLKEAGVYLDHCEIVTDYAECTHGEGSETMFKHYDRFWTHT